MKILTVIKKVLSRQYPYNKYGWGDWYYKNVKQIYYFWRFTRKANKDIFMLWDATSVKLYMFEWFKQHVILHGRYIPAEYWAEYQVAEFRQQPEKYNMTMDDVESLKQYRLIPYLFVEKCFKYVTDNAEYNEALFWAHQAKFSTMPNFIKSDRLFEGEECYELKDTREVTYLDFIWSFDDYGKLSIETSDMIISDSEWRTKFTTLEQAIKDKDTEFLNGIIKHRACLWD